MAEEKKEEEAIDPLEFAPEVAIDVKFDQDWIDATAALKKWDEKKAKIEELCEACKNVKIKPGNFGPLAAFLKKECSGSNMNISISAIKGCCSLAEGLRQNFGPQVKEVISVIMLKFKEKRPLILDEIKKFLDAVPKCTNFEEIGPEVIPLITNNAPGVKNGTLKFVESLSVVTYIDVLQRVQDDLLPAVVKVMEDKDGTVRDNALHCMGILKGRLGEGAVGKLIKDLNT